MSDERDDARSVRIPKLSIETDPTQPDEAEETSTGDTARSAWLTATDAVHDAMVSDDLRGAVGFIKGLGATAWDYAKRHPFTVTYGFVGLVLAVLILTIGLWDTIVIAVFVMVGAVIGQIRDGDNGIVNFFRRLLRGGR